MRFDNITSVKITDIKLDENNYRFGHASSQQDCINKIYNYSPTNFKELMHSIADDDIVDPILIYNNNKEKIVYDGNRRTSVLMVLNNPDLAPNENIKNQVIELLQNTKNKFNVVDAYISDNLDVIAKTVYERHAAHGGVNRVRWSAYANAKYRYNTKQQGDSNWIAIALLMSFQEKETDFDEFILSNEFSFETFARVIKSAYKNGYISSAIYNIDNNEIITNINEFKQASEFTKNLLQLLKSREISLSRDGNYASSANVDKFLNQYFTKVSLITPPTIRNTKKRQINENIKNAPSTATVVAKEHTVNENLVLNNNLVNHFIEDENYQHIEVAQLENKKDDFGIIPNGNTGLFTPVQAQQEELELGSISNTSIRLNKPKFLSKIRKNNDLIRVINNLNILKFNTLYKSLLDINPEDHPLLTIVGIWSFLDSLSNLDQTHSSDFSAYFKGKLKEYPFYNKEEGKVIKSIFDWFLLEGNFNKHDSSYATVNGLDIVDKFNRIQSAIAFVMVKYKDGQH